MAILSYVFYIFIAIILLLFMVLIHELGHYIAGRILKFKITEFSIGFGKAIWTKVNKRGEKISLRVFPLGGYCAFAGEEDDDNEEKVKARETFLDGVKVEDEKTSSSNKTKKIKSLKSKKTKKSKPPRMKYDEKMGLFNNYAPWKRIIVFFAGVFMNFIAAIVFSCILLCTLGGGDIVKVKSVDSAYSTQQSLQAGDVIYEINGQKLDIAYGTNFQTAISNVVINAGKFLDENPSKDINDFSFSMYVRHSNGEYELMQDVKLFEKIVDGEETFVLGISLEYYVHSFWEALGRCWSYAFGLAWMVLKSLWLLITFQLPLSAIGGPIATIGAIATASQMNFANLLLLIPLISANLAVFNLLPFPALDGSHIVFAIIEWIRGRPIKKKVDNIIHFTGLCVLFGFVIIVDILNLIL